MLRLAIGDKIILFNGTGVEATARITSATRHEFGYEVTSVDRPDRQPPIQLTVGLALLKGDRFEIAVQKLTELGVTQIVPLLTERSVVSFDDARGWLKRAERYARIAREAAEQSERVTLPTLTKPTTLGTFLHDHAVTVLLERDEAIPICDLEPGPTMAIAIGPEGGWSEREQILIVRDAAGTTSLGRLILRAETAAIVAAGALVQQAWANEQRQGHGGNRT